MTVDIVILAGGEGKRLGADIPKPLVPLAGFPMLEHVLKLACVQKYRRLVVVTPPHNIISDWVKKRVPSALCVCQPVPLGTADALSCALPHVEGEVLILCADLPLLTAPTIKKLLIASKKGPSLLTFKAQNPNGYGRIVRNAADEITHIVEHRDASASIRKINEVYAGVMVAPKTLLTKTVAKVVDTNAASERYLTDIVRLATSAGHSVIGISASAEECYGVNNAIDLEQAERLLQWRYTGKLLQRKVRLLDRRRVDIRGEVKVGLNVEIDVNVILEGSVELQHGCRIGAHTVIRNCRIGKGTIVHPFSHLESAKVGANCEIGPYVRLRSGTQLADSVRLGNFVEIKNAQLDTAVKANHLSYIGDAQVGAKTNIGAGVITCNYDGKKKHQTVIGRNVFIGSDTQLIAPVKIGNDVYVGAGSTITKDVPAGGLALSRVRQSVREKK